MKNVIAIAIKDLRLLVRDRAGLFFTFAFPLIYALFFGSIFGGGEEGPRKVPLILVDQDSSAQSIEFLQALAAREELSIRYDSLEGARQRLKRGRATAAVVLLPGFGREGASIFAGDPPEILLLSDPSRGAEAGLLQGLLFEQAMRGLSSRFQDPASFLPEIRSWRDSLAGPGAAGEEFDHLRRWADELDRFLVAEEGRKSGDTESSDAGGDTGPSFAPLRVTQEEVTGERIGPRSAFEISFPQGLIWGVISCAATFAVSLVVERREGTLRRLCASPVTRRSILGGKALACFGLIVALCVGLFVIGRLLFGVKPDSILLLVPAILSTAIAFTGLMQLISVLGRTERSVGGYGWAMMMVFAMTGGGMVPLFFMPEWMRTIGHISPVKWSILAMEGAVWRGFSPADMLLPCTVLCLTGLLAFAIGVTRFDWNSNA